MPMDNERPFKLGQHGGKRVKGERGPNSTLKRGSSSVAYIEARLRRDAEDGCREAAVMLQGIRDGRVTPYACAIEMNYCKRREPTGRVEYPNVTRANDWKMYKLFYPVRPELKAPEKAPGVASTAEGEDRSMDLRSESSAAAKILK